jgi:lipopolysaccharide transport system ATP-binding protein
MFEGERILNGQGQYAVFTSITILNAQQEPANRLLVDETFTIVLGYDVKQHINFLEVSVAFYDARTSVKVFQTSQSSKVPSSKYNTGIYCSSVSIPEMFLAPGNYYVEIALHTPNTTMYDHYREVISFQVIEGGSDQYMYMNADIGSVLVDFDWECIPSE